MDWKNTVRMGFLSAWYTAKSTLKLPVERFTFTGSITMLTYGLHHLKKLKANCEDFKWYDLSDFATESRIDLLIVDGPPVSTVRFARYPALPLLADYLSKQCTIINHDTNRKEETGIVKRWLKEFPEFTADIRQTDKGITILTR
jgi:hypothetical protein